MNLFIPLALADFCGKFFGELNSYVLWGGNKCYLIHGCINWDNKKIDLRVQEIEGPKGRMDMGYEQRGIKDFGFFG